MGSVGEQSRGLGKAGGGAWRVKEADPAQTTVS